MRRSVTWHVSGLSGYAALQTFEFPVFTDCHCLSVTDSTANPIRVRSLYYLFIHIFMHFTQMLTIKVTLVEQVENLKLVFSWAMQVYWFLSHIYGTDLTFSATFIIRATAVPSSSPIFLFYFSFYVLSSLETLRSLVSLLSSFIAGINTVVFAGAIRC